MYLYKKCIYRGLQWKVAFIPTLSHNSNIIHIHLDIICVTVLDNNINVRDAVIFSMKKL